MFGHILKRDLKRKKTMNTILFVFIVLASMFMASSLSNIVTVLNGLDYYLDEAGVGDVIAIKIEMEGDDSLNQLLENSKAINKIRTEEIVFLNEDFLSKNDEPIKISNTSLIQCVGDSDMKYFTEDGKGVTSVESGKIMLQKAFATDQGLKPGDMLHFTVGNVEADLEYIGYFKDALLGSPIMSNVRVLVNEDLYQQLMSDEDIRQNYSGKIVHFDTDDIDTLTSDMAKLQHTIFTGNRSVVKMCYVMDMLVAAVILVVAIALIVVAFLVLKFMVNLSIQDEFREIGVMKAIGLKNGKVRGLYIVKYLVFSIVGAGLGLVLSVPFGKTLMKVATTNLVLGNKAGFLLNIIGAILVVLAILGYAYKCTGIIKKSSPIDAIRNGETGERYKKKKSLRIGRFPGNASTFMAVNDIKSAPKRYLTIIIAFALCTLLTLIIGNTTSTIRSDKLAHLFGYKQTDMYISSSGVEELGEDGTKTPTEEYFRDTLKKFEGLVKEKTGYDVEASWEIIYYYNFESDGKEFSIFCQKGLNTTIDEYRIYEGVSPASSDEIIITKSVADKLKVNIGDSVTMKTPKGDKKVLVVALMETMNNMGESIRLHQDFDVDPENCAGCGILQANYKDHPSKAEIDKRNAEISKAFGDVRVLNTQEMCADSIGVTETMETVEMFLLVVLVIVITLTVILMETSFISSEKNQIAILKAMGFNDTTVILWQVKRFTIVGLIAVIIATAISVPVTALAITPIFRMMGAKTIDYKISPLKVFAIYPMITLCVTALFTYIVALKTKRIKANDTSNIE